MFLLSLCPVYHSKTRPGEAAKRAVRPVLPELRHAPAGASRGNRGRCYHAAQHVPALCLGQGKRLRWLT